MAVQNAENGVVWDSYGSLRVICNVTIRYRAYDFLFDFNRNHASILYHCQDISGYLSKVVDFNPPHLHLAPPVGGDHGQISGDLWRRKSRVTGLSCGVVCVILRLALLVQLRLVTDTDTDTDGQTQAHG